MGFLLPVCLLRSLTFHKCCCVSSEHADDLQLTTSHLATAAYIYYRAKSFVKDFLAVL